MWKEAKVTQSYKSMWLWQKEELIMTLEADSFTDTCQLPPQHQAVTRTRQQVRHLVMKPKTLHAVCQQIDGILASIPQRLHDLRLPAVWLTALDHSLKFGSWQIRDKLGATNTLVVASIGEDSWRVNQDSLQHSTRRWSVSQTWTAIQSSTTKEKLLQTACDCPTQSCVISPASFQHAMLPIPTFKSNDKIIRKPHTLNSKLQHNKVKIN